MDKYSKSLLKRDEKYKFPFKMEALRASFFHTPKLHQNCQMPVSDVVAANFDWVVSPVCSVHLELMSINKPAAAAATSLHLSVTMHNGHMTDTHTDWPDIGWPYIACCSERSELWSMLYLNSIIWWSGDWLFLYFSRECRQLTWIGCNSNDKKLIKVRHPQ